MNLKPKFEPLDAKQTYIYPRELNDSKPFIEHFDKLLKSDDISCDELFVGKTAMQWIEDAKVRPIPKMLFGEFWYEFEIGILFADTGLGKSILAVQIADSISKGEAVKGFKLQAVQQKVLYFDFELNDKQFENRYSVSYKNHYQFDDNFMRVEINDNASIPSGESFDEFFRNSIERAINKYGAKILIIDNLTYLSNETEKARDALPLMKHLKALKNKYSLSILVLAHTPKRDLSKPITRNDLAGSKMLINFTDSCFTVGESASDKNLRYLKQIKVRQSEFIYDSENVCVCQLHKPYNRVEFDLLSYGSERDHLKLMTEKGIEGRNVEIQELTNQGKSSREVGNLLGVSHTTVTRLLKSLNG